MKITTSLRVLSTVGGLVLIGVSGYVNVLNTASFDMQLVVGALAVGTALAAWVITPMFGTGRPLLAVLALLGVLSGELYGFVQTSERLLAARDARSSQTATANQSWVQRKEALDYAIAAAMTECAGGRGPRCVAAEAKVDEKRSILAGTRVPVDTNRLAGLIGWTPTVVDLIPTLAGSTALNLLGFVLLAFAHSGSRIVEVKAAEVKAITETEPMPDDRELAELRKLLVGRSRPMTNQEIADSLGVSKAESSKRISKAVAAGIAKREPRGREVAVTYLH